MATAPRPDTIWSLQLGRAVAALMVLVYHAGAYARDMPDWLAAHVSRGYLGVDFFFVLSGFIIYHVNRHETPGAAWQRNYVMSRATRIYVPYLPIGIGLALAYTLLPTVASASRPWGWLPSLTLLPTDVQPALLVAWTLQIELLFYVVFWLGFRLGRPMTVVAIWAAAGAAWTLTQGGQALPIDHLLGAINVEFLFGMAAAWLIASRVPSSALLAGAAVLIGIYVAFATSHHWRILFAAGIALALAPIVRGERRGDWRFPQLGKLLGDASYAIYLVHLPLLALLSRFVTGSWAIVLALLVIAGVVAGIAYYFLYERPALKLVRTWLLRRQRRTAASAGLVQT